MELTNNQLDFTYSKSTFLAFNCRSGGSLENPMTEIGLTLVKDGVIAEVFFTKVSQDSFYGRKNKNEPELPEVCPKIEHYFAQVEYVGAFNISVHKSYLEKSLSYYGLKLPEKKYFCAYHMALAHVKPIGGDYRFESVCQTLSIPTVDIQHNHLNRAFAAAEIVLTIEATEKIDLVTYLTQKIINSEKSKISFFKLNLPEANLEGLQYLENIEDFDFFIKGKNIVITGDFSKFPKRKVLESIIKEKGGAIQAGISSKTNIVIMGQAPGPSKVEKLHQLIGKGVLISLVNENLINKLTN
jgi:DNA polymerase-3 subunit epsilon